MDSLFNRNTNDVASYESGTTGATPQHAMNDAPAAVVNPLYAEEPAGEHAASAGSPTPTSDARAYVAEPAPRQATPTKECDVKQPGRAANLLLVATLAAVCGLAGGLAGGAIMSAATGGSTQAAQGGMGSQGGMQGGGMQGGGMQDGGAPSADGTTNGSEGSANGNAPSGQALTGAPDASGSSDASADGSTGDSNGAPSDAPAGTGDGSATSQTSLSA